MSSCDVGWHDVAHRVNCASLGASAGSTLPNRKGELDLGALVFNGSSQSRSAVIQQRMATSAKAPVESIEGRSNDRYVGWRRLGASRERGYQVVFALDIGGVLNYIGGGY